MVFYARFGALKLRALTRHFISPKTVHMIPIPVKNFGRACMTAAPELHSPSLYLSLPRWLMLSGVLGWSNKSVGVLTNNRSEGLSRECTTTFAHTVHALYEQM